MKINGRYYIDLTWIPESESKILDVLKEMNEESTVVQISTKMSGEFSDASLYSLLGRLNKRGLVNKNEVIISVDPGRPVKRVKWSLTEKSLQVMHGNEIPSYRDILVAHSYLGHVSVLIEHANVLGYKYILWNDRLYKVDCDPFIDTGFIRKDVDAKAGLI